MLTKQLEFLNLDINITLIYTKFQEDFGDKHKMSQFKFGDNVYFSKDPYIIIDSYCAKVLVGKTQLRI